MPLQKLQPQPIANVKPFGFHPTAHVNRPVSHHPIHIAEEEFDGGEFSPKRG
jgi:hypothetical protein